MRLISKKKLAIIAAISCYTIASAASAQPLIKAYQDSLKNDYQYLQAKNAYEVAKDSLSEAWSAYLPKLSTSGDVWTNFSESDITDFAINAQQTIFNWGAIRTISKARAYIKQSLFSFSAQEQILMQRVSQAYFNVIEKKAFLAVTKQQLTSMKKQLSSAKERYNVGHATVTDIDRVKANYDLYRSQLIATSVALSQAKQALFVMTGKLYKKYPTLVNRFIPKKPEPLNLTTWMEKAHSGNLSYKTAEAGVLTAKAEVGVASGDFLPNIVANGSYYPKKAPSSNKNFLYGIAVSYNLFQGGYAFAATKKAEAQYLTAVDARRAAFNQATANMNNAYAGVLQGVYQLRAEALALKSNKDALEHTQAGYIAGTQTILDVLDQQNKLFDAQKTYILGRIGYLNNVVNIELAAGTLSPKTLMGIERWLHA